MWEGEKAELYVMHRPTVVSTVMMAKSMQLSSLLSGFWQIDATVNIRGITFKPINLKLPTSFSKG